MKVWEPAPNQEFKLDAKPLLLLARKMYPSDYISKSAYDNSLILLGKECLVEEGLYYDSPGFKISSTGCSPLFIFVSNDIVNIR